MATHHAVNRMLHLLSNMVTDASGLSFMASMNISGRNLVRRIRTFGPTSLSVIILPNRAAVCSRTVGLVELQNRFNRYISAPKGMTEQYSACHALASISLTIQVL